MKKLEKPPHAPNWVRYNYPDLEKTKKEIVRFALAFPPITYAHALKLIEDRVHLGVEWDMLERSARTQGRGNSREHCLELVQAFRNYEDDLDVKGVKSYDFEILPWKISRSVSVPVKPLSTLLQNGKLEPLFVFGWKSFPLTDYQMRLLMTVIEEAVFTLEDYRHSRGHFITLPYCKNEGKRICKVWRRGDFDLLSSNQLKEQVDIYLESLAFAQELLKGESTKKEDARKSAEDVVDPRQPTLGLF